MIQLPVVGPHDYQTKREVLKTVRGAINIEMMTTDRERILYRFAYNAWPGSSMFEIVNRSGNREGPAWMAQISLGDDEFLTPKEFIGLLSDMQKESGELNQDEVTEYLKRLIDTEVEAWKMMKKIDQLNHYYMGATAETIQRKMIYGYGMKSSLL